MNDCNVAETLGKLEGLKNSQLVAINNQKRLLEEQQEASSIFSNNAELAARREQDLLQVKREKLFRERQRHDLINELANSDDPAITILAKKNYSLRQSSAISLSSSMQPQAARKMPHLKKDTTVAASAFDPLEGIAKLLDYSLLISHKNEYILIV